MTHTQMSKMHYIIAEKKNGLFFEAEDLSVFVHLEVIRSRDQGDKVLCQAFRFIIVCDIFWAAFPNDLMTFVFISDIHKCNMKPKNSNN